MDKDLIRKYLEGNCSKEEEHLVLRYLESGQETNLHAQIMEVEKSVDTHIPAELSATMLREIHSQLPPVQRKGLLAVMKQWRVAAGILVLVMASAAAYFGFQQEQSPAPVAQQIVSIQNNDLSVKKTTLPDGTSIWLNSQAAISYDRNSFNQKMREVSVTGEVFFDVAPDNNKPFSVRTGQLITLVLGTAFNVENFQQEKDIRITLLQGKVAVEAAGQRRELTPGQLLNYNTGNAVIDVRQTDTSTGREWLEGRIVFNDLPMHDVLKRIESMYTISILCDADILKGKRLTGTYQRIAPADLLRKILFVHGLRFTEKQGEFIIKP